VAEVDRRVRTHAVETEFLRGPGLVRIVTPEGHQGLVDERRVLFVLPVEPDLHDEYGDGLREVLALDLHVRHGLTLVAPTFTDWPWFADHATDPQKRHESHFIERVLPAVDTLCPAGRTRRMLMGFSKSGYGAFSLLLRHPEPFDVAGAWDAPLMIDATDWPIGGAYGSAERFGGYRVAELLRARAGEFRRPPRLALLGRGVFAGDMAEAHELMQSLGVAHITIGGPVREHRWDTGWVPRAVKTLARMVGAL
jgi:hypothetical protein